MAGESQQTPGSEPDPTVLTTEQLLREIQNVKDWTEALVDSAKELTTEQFASVTKLLAMIESSRVEQKKDTKEALDAALAAAKEAVKEQTSASEKSIAKSEVQFTAAQQQSATQFQTGLAALADKYDDLKENQVVQNQDFKDRLTRIETAKLTENHNTEQSRLDYGLLVSIASVFIAIIAVVVVVLLTNSSPG